MSPSIGPDRRAVLVLGVLALMALTGYAAAVSSPERGFVTGIWPIGLATGALLLTPRSRWGVVLASIAAIALLTLLAGDRPVGPVAGYAAGTVLEAWVAARLLLPPDGGRPRLRSDTDLRRYLTAALVASALGAALAALTSVATDFGEPWRVAVGIGLAHLASQLSVVPVFLQLPLQGAIARRGERAAQWAVIVVGTPIVFVPGATPSLVFLAIPILAWGALRITPLESLAQMVAVLGVAIVLTTSGRGPFADAPVRYDLPVDMRGVLLSAFAVSCAVIVVPLILRVGEYVGAARAAAAERDLVRGIVDGASGIAIIGTDGVGRITLFNPGAERLLGYRAEEVLGEFTPMLHSAQAVSDKAAELGVEDDFVAVVLEMVRARHVGSTMRFLRKDGVERVHALTISEVTDGRGRPTGYVSTSEDITDQLDAQQALRDALEAERRAVERLEDVDAVKDQFVSTVSHELRTPITSILGYLEMLSDGTLGALHPTQADALGRVQSNSHRLLALIDELLTLSRVAEKSLQRSEEHFDLREAVSTAYGVVSPAWEARRLEVSLAVPDGPVSTYGDREMLERVVVNLVGNAAKFTDDGGAVTVRLAVEDEVSVLRVADTGIGIPAEEQAQLFTRFFRSSLAEGRAIPGSGLGLSITHAIVEQHGGRIAVASEAGLGTTVEVRLPIRLGAPID